MDVLTKAQRSHNMSRIRGTNTGTERALRSLLYSNGLRGYRLHAKLIKGRPDLYFPRHKLAVFIDGCFWHVCPKCYIKPVSNNSYWAKKAADNQARDRRVNTALKKNGIRVLRFWEHEIRKNPMRCIGKILLAINHPDAAERAS